MRCALVCLFLVTVLLLNCVDSKKSFSTRRKSSGTRRGQTNHQKPPPQPPATPHRNSDSNTNFLNSERVNSGNHGFGSSSSHASTNTHHRPNPFDNAPSAPQMPKQSIPQTNGPIGFEKLNTDVRQKSASSGVASAPSYPGSQGGSYPGKQSVPNGPPPAYPGYGNPSSGTHGGFESPPAYPGRPVNAPPVYSANNPQRSNVGGYPQQNNYQQSGLPHQQSPYPQQQWVNQGQNNFGYPNSGGGFGNYPNQGHNQGFGSYPSGGYGGYGNSHMGGQSFPGYGGNSFGGSPFGHSNSYGGSPFSSPGFGGFGGNSFGGNSYGGYGSNHYSPNSFGYSSNPGIFGSMFGGQSKYSPYGYHKKSRFGGLPIPIPIPIPIPLGMFGGRSHNHRVLDTFVKNQTVNDSDNSTNVYILNNSTVTPCTTDQFIYDSLNVTVMSCTAVNCTAIKVFTTTNVSGEVKVHSAGITMCLEDNTTYSSFADNVNPTVSDLHKYWMKVCKELVSANVTTNAENAGNVTVKTTQTLLNETVVKEESATTDQSSTSEPSTVQPPVESTTVKTPIEPIVQNSSESSNSSFCENFDCSWIEMCLPSVEIVDRCSSADCPFTRTGYKPCVTIKMCRSPSTPISTFATLNTTLSKVDQFNNVKSVYDVANLTLISFIPPVLPANCSQSATDPACQRPVNSSEMVVPQGNSAVNVPQVLCAPGVNSGTTEVANNGTVCVPAQTTEGLISPDAATTTTDSSTTHLG